MTANSAYARAAGARASTGGTREHRWHARAPVFRAQREGAWLLDTELQRSRNGDPSSLLSPSLPVVTGRLSHPPVLCGQVIRATPWSGAPHHSLGLFPFFNLWRHNLQVCSRLLVPGLERLCRSGSLASFPIKTYLLCLRTARSASTRSGIP